MTYEQLMKLPIINLGSYYLRVIKHTDAEDLFEILSDEETTYYLPIETHKHIEETYEFLCNVLLSKPQRGIPYQYAIVDKENDKTIGSIGFTNFSIIKGCGEIGYYINKKFWNKGIATKATLAMINFGMEFYNLTNITIGHLDGNNASKRVIEKCGFELTHIVEDYYINNDGKSFDDYMYKLNFSKYKTIEEKGVFQ